MKKNTCRGTILSFALAAIPLSLAWASPPSAPVTGASTQPDGSPVTLTQHGHGDQLHYETREGYTVVRDENARWVYARPRQHGAARALSETAIEASTLVVGRDDPAAAGLSKHLRSRVPQLSNHPRSEHRAVGGANPLASKLGSIPVLVILGYYDDALAAPDCTACATTDPEAVQQNVFSLEDGSKSVADYFSQVSNSRLQIAPVVEDHGTADDGVVGWLRLGASTPEATATNTSVYKSNRVAADAINAAMEHVDYTAYDANGDGKITSNELTLLVILAGYEASYGRNAQGQILADDATSPRLWGQSRSFATAYSGVPVPTQTKNGHTVSINTRRGGMTYSLMGELHGNHPATMGIIIHELGHSMLALPDLYDISGKSNGVGIWSVMSFGSWGQTVDDSHPGDTPVMLDAWSRLALGWVDPVTPTVDSITEINAASRSDATVIKLPTANSNEYFLVENRQNSGYDAGLTYLVYTARFGGLAVWHIDDGFGSPGMNNDNSGIARRRVDLVAAADDERLDNKTSYGSTGNLFFEGHKTELDDATDPSTHLNSGDESGVGISAISPSADAMTARFAYETRVSETLSSSSVSTQTLAQSASTGGGGGAFYVGFALLAFFGVARRR